MSDITFVVTDESITVIECKVVGSRKAFTADNLVIWMDGHSNYHHPDCITNLAMQCCIERHIPLLTLKQVPPAWHGSRFETNTKRMF